MSKTRDLLKKRQKELQAELSKLRPLQEELAEIEAALSAMEPVNCIGCYGGCSVCRTGERYR